MPKCTKCGKETTGEPIKTWNLGEKTKVSRYQCPDGHQFNAYETVAKETPPGTPEAPTKTKKK